MQADRWNWWILLQVTWSFQKKKTWSWWRRWVIDHKVSQLQLHRASLPYPSWSLQGFSHWPGLQSYIDHNLNRSKVYLPSNNPKDGSLDFFGTIKSLASYEDQQWSIKMSLYNTTASSQAKSNSFILGKHSWAIEGDSQKCFKGRTDVRDLKLTSCVDGQFTCSDGACIKMEQR